jgi:hypothetical protein
MDIDVGFDPVADFGGPDEICAQLAVISAAGGCSLNAAR